MQTWRLGALTLAMALGAGCQVIGNFEELQTSGSGGAATNAGAGGTSGGGASGAGGANGASGSAGAGGPGNPLPRLESIFAGATHSCARIAGDLRAFCWGSNEFGQLGVELNFQEAGATLPVLVNDTLILRAQGRFSLGGSHSCALLDVAGLFCWGHNGSGQAGGVKGTTYQPQAVEVVPGLFQRGSVLSVALGGAHSCALTAKDPLITNAYCWGSNRYGQLGQGATSGMPLPNPKPAIVRQGALPDGLPLANLEAIATGLDHTCVVQKLAAGNPTLLCWGKNTQGQLGRALGVGNAEAHPDPLAVQLPPWDVTKPLSELALGDQHSCVLVANGAGAGGSAGAGEAGEAGSSTVYCWGSNEFGQRGATGVSSEGPHLPSPVSGNAGPLSGVKQLRSGAHHLCALRETGNVICWGSNKYGQLGNSQGSGSNAPQTEPVLVLDADSQPLAGINELALGAEHSCALRTGSGELFCWGRNQSGQLGPYPDPNPSGSNPLPKKINGAL